MRASNRITLAILCGCTVLQHTPLLAVTFTWGGQVRLDSAFDTRQNIGTDDSAVVLFPEPVELDSNGCDINAHSHFGMTPSTTNLFFKVHDLHIHNAELKGYVNTYFIGATNYSLGIPRIWFAFVKALWPYKSLLVGLYYHPTLVENCEPNNVNFNGGMPIASYARWPQIRFKYQWNHVAISTSLYSQFAIFSSPGPRGYSPQYMRNSITPGLCATLEWFNESTTAGVLFNVKRLQPALYTTPELTTKKYATDAKVTSVMGSAWLGFNIGYLRWNNQLSVGQNGPDFNTLGGYAVSDYSATTGKCTYTNIGFASMWTDIEYTRYNTCSPGIFAGIVTSLGAHKPVHLDPATNTPTFYGFYHALDSVLRIAPRLTTTIAHVFVGFEVDYARAWFGAMNNRGKHPHTNAVDTLRILLQTHYDF